MKSLKLKKEPVEKLPSLDVLFGGNHLEASLVGCLPQGTNPYCNSRSNDCNGNSTPATCNCGSDGSNPCETESCGYGGN